MDRTAVIYSASARLYGRSVGAFVLVELAGDCGFNWGQEDYRGFFEVACVLPGVSVHRAELIAVRQALRAFEVPLECPVDLVSSNKYIVDVLEPFSRVKAKANVDLVTELRDMNDGELSYDTRWCQAGSGDTGNDRARFLAERTARTGRPWTRDKLKTKVWREGRGVVVDFPWNAEGPLLRQAGEEDPMQFADGWW